MAPAAKCDHQSSREVQRKDAIKVCKLLLPSMKKGILTHKQYVSYGGCTICFLYPILLSLSFPVISDQLFLNTQLLMSNGQNGCMAMLVLHSCCKSRWDIYARWKLRIGTGWFYADFLAYSSSPLRYILIALCQKELLRLRSHSQNSTGSSSSANNNNNNVSAWHTRQFS